MFAVLSIVIIQYCGQSWSSHLERHEEGGPGAHNAEGTDRDYSWHFWSRWQISNWSYDWEKVLVQLPNHIVMNTFESDLQLLMIVDLRGTLVWSRWICIWKTSCSAASQTRPDSAASQKVESDLRFVEETVGPGLQRGPWHSSISKFDPSESLQAPKLQSVHGKGSKVQDEPLEEGAEHRCGSRGGRSGR